MSKHAAWSWLPLLKPAPDMRGHGVEGEGRSCFSLWEVGGFAWEEGKRTWAAGERMEQSPQWKWILTSRMAVSSNIIPTFAPACRRKKIDFLDLRN